jgi:septum site-determining protein MinC
MVDNILKSQAFKLKGRFYMFTVLQILEVDPVSFSQQLMDVVAQAPRLFDSTPVVLDCSAIDSDALDLQQLCRCVREQGLFPVALQGGNAFLNTCAQAQGLAVLHASSAHDKPLMETSIEPAIQTPEVSKTKCLLNPVRSGQQVVSKGADLIVAASVSHGAELLAEGNIHVYGALRGKALAGIAGDKDARIFCQSLDAELVAIAGFYRLREAMEPCTQPCQIFLQDDHIQIERL